MVRVALGGDDALPFEAAVRLGPHPDAKLARAWARARDAAVVEYIASRLAPRAEFVRVIHAFGAEVERLVGAGAHGVFAFDERALVDPELALAQGKRVPGSTGAWYFYRYAATPWVAPTVSWTVAQHAVAYTLARVDARELANTRRHLAAFLTTRLPPPTVLAVAAYAEATPP